jgi:hypothetical protein
VLKAPKEALVFAKNLQLSAFKHMKDKLIRFLTSTKQYIKSMFASSCASLRKIEEVVGWFIIIQIIDNY